MGTGNRYLRATIWLFECFTDCIVLAFLIILCILEPWVVCLRVDDLWRPQHFWKWRRMWKSDETVEAEKQQKALARRARCCANDRDEWRTKARARELLPQKLTDTRLRVWMRKVRWWLQALRESPETEDEDSRYDPTLPQHPILRLPLELREQIYAHYVLHWSSKRLGITNDEQPGSPIPPHEPPITRVSRLIRSESLSVFYRTARFPLVFHLKHTQDVLRPPFEAVDWYYHLGPSKISLIRHLELHLCLRNTTYAIPQPFVIHVDFGKGRAEANYGHAHYMEMCINVPNGMRVLTWQETDFKEILLRRCQVVAESLGPTGVVSAKDVYAFVE